MSNRYFKFHNSNSKKVPFFVYLKLSEGTIRDVSGCPWANLPKNRIEITEEEFEKVQQSWYDTEPNIGDEVVVTDYCPSSRRYSKVTGMRINVINRKVCILENGYEWPINEVRKKEFIHQS